MGSRLQVLLQTLNNAISVIISSSLPVWPHLTGPDLVPDNLNTGQSDLSGEGGLGLPQPLLQVYQERLISLDLIDSLPPLQDDSLDLVCQGLSLGVKGHQLGPATGQRG